VNDPLVVRGRHGGQHRQHDVRRLLERQPPAPLDEAGQVFAFQQLHDQEGPSAFDADVGHVDRVRVAHPRRQLRLAQEPGARVRVGRQKGAHHLDRHLLSDRQVDAFVDRAHPPFADQAHHLVLAEASPDGKHRAGRLSGVPVHGQPPQAKAVT